MAVATYIAEVAAMEIGGPIDPDLHCAGARQSPSGGSNAPIFGDKELEGPSRLV